MNVDRAIEIINSKGVIDVHYKNEPIWIESIDSGKSMAHVKSLRNDRSLNVTINELTES